MKKISKSIINRIDAINEMLPIVNNSNNYASTMADSTYESYVILTKEIEFKNQFVWIYEDKKFHSYGFQKRYNVNKNYDLEQLKYDLTIIKRAFNKLIKN